MEEKTEFMLEQEKQLRELNEIQQIFNEKIERLKELDIRVEIKLFHPSWSKSPENFTLLCA